jgi:hypothetical protein
VTDAPSTEPEPLRFYRSFTVGPDFPSNLARASFRYLLLSPAGLGRVLIIAAVLAVAAYLVVLMGIATAVGFVVERRRFRDRIPAGSEFAVGFRENTILMRSPMDTAEVAFDKYQSFETTGDFVVLRQRSSRILNFLPAECFTPESLGYLREKIPLPSKR